MQNFIELRELALKLNVIGKHDQLCPSLSDFVKYNQLTN